MLEGAVYVFDPILCQVKDLGVVHFVICPPNKNATLEGIGH